MFLSKCLWEDLTKGLWVQNKWVTGGLWKGSNTSKCSQKEALWFNRIKALKAPQVKVHNRKADTTELLRINKDLCSLTPTKLEPNLARMGTRRWFCCCKKLGQIHGELLSTHGWPVEDKTFEYTYTLRQSSMYLLPSWKDLAESVKCWQWQSTVKEQNLGRDNTGMWKWTQKAKNTNKPPPNPSNSLALPTGSPPFTNFMWECVLPQTSFVDLWMVLACVEDGRIVKASNSALHSKFLCRLNTWQIYWSNNTFGVSDSVWVIWGGCAVWGSSIFEWPNRVTWTNHLQAASTKVYVHTFHGQDKNQFGIFWTMKEEGKCEVQNLKFFRSKVQIWRGGKFMICLDKLVCTSESTNILWKKYIDEMNIVWVFE